MKKSKMLIPILACSTVFVSDKSGLNLVQAQTQYTEISSKQGDITSQGLIGYFYKDSNFRENLFLTTAETGDLTLSTSDLHTLIPEDHKTVQSAIWKGHVKIDREGAYAFSTSNEKNTRIFIDQKELSPSQKMNLEPDRLYEITIKHQINTSSTKGMELKLYWETPDNEKQVIPSESLFAPNNKQKPLKSRTKRSLRTVGNLDTNDEIMDSDNDGIPDSLEIEGYTVDVKNKKTIIVPWIEHLHTKKGLTQYKSSPEKWSTASDPYSDFAKVTGRIDKLVKKEARNPLVAAYPIVDVNMERIILSKNRDITQENGGSANHSISHMTSTSKTDGISSSVNAEISASLFDFGAKISTNFTKDHSSTVSLENSISNTNEANWSQTIGIKESEAAYVGAGIRYVNSGTAPIYQAKPTSTLSLTDGTPLATIMAKENQIANHISPGEYYPRKNDASILLNTKDDFGSMPITLNLQQLQYLEREKKFHLDTDQVNGKVGVVQRNGAIEKTLDWDEYIGQIKATSARLLLITGDETIERRVAAIDPEDPLEQTKPEITLKEALKLAFDLEENNKSLKSPQKTIEQFELIFDKETGEAISSQLKSLGIQDIYQGLDAIQVHANMNIQIVPKGWEKNIKTGRKYYFDENGRKVTGWKEIDDSMHYFNENGVMEK
ncbi:binary toxin-like calcium binding domain-containing protein [Bacillus cereus group sp. BfR-BA-01349]|uniref:binary toxin-like calcium binding domain-containing protein n=1 Tax=Bacillus cereus group sp. BfR-BA-01349 TaxID=2920312 RepID=UPI001F568521